MKNGLGRGGRLGPPRGEMSVRRLGLPVPHGLVNQVRSDKNQGQRPPVFNPIQRIAKLRVRECEETEENQQRTSE